MLTENNREIFEKYYQNSPSYYIKQLESYQESGKCSFSVAAFFLGLFWMAYRKMYRVVLIIIGIILAETIIEEMLLNFNVISPDAYEVIDRLSMLVWGGVIGIISNKLYIKRSIKDVEEVLSNNYNDNDINDSITRKGGVNWIAPFILLFGLVSIVILAL